MRLFGRQVSFRLWPTLAALPVLAVLLGLGGWQLQRLAEKDALIARLEARLAEPPVSLDAALADPAAHEYARVTVTGRFFNERELQIPGRSHQGAQGRLVVTPLLLADGRSLIVDRGWVPDGKAKPETRPESLPDGEVTLEGILRLPAAADSQAAAAGSTTERIFYVFDLPRMAAAAALERPITAFYLVALDADGAASLPIGQPQRVEIRNDHLQYALTWFALAFACAVILLLLQSRPAGAGGKRRLLLLETRLAGGTGHNAALARNLTAAATQLGFAPTLVCHRSAPAALAKTLTARPYLTQPPEARAPRPGFDAATATTLLAEELRRLGRGLAPEDQVLFPSLWPLELQALAAWLAGPAAPTARVAGFVHDMAQWQREAERQRDHGAGLDAAVARLAALPAERRPRLYAFAAGAAEWLAATLRLPVEMLPLPFAPEGQPAPSAARVLASPGTQRPEKGGTLLPEIAAALAERLPDWRWTINAAVAPRVVAQLAPVLEALSGQPNVTLLPAPVSRERHLAQLAEAALVLLPYRAEAYRDRASAVFSEAVALGRPVVVPAGTNMAEEIAAGHAAGQSYEEESAEAIAAAVAAAVARLPELAVAATALAPAWRARHAPVAVLAEVTGTAVPAI